MLQKLRQPFPDKADLKQSLLTIFYVGVFVALFLFLIRPFNIEGPWADLTLASIGFGLVTVVFGWVFELSTRYVFRIKTDGPSWTLGKWILSSVILVVWIALGNYLFVNILSGWRAVGYFNFIRMIGYTSLIGVFPVALSGLVIQLRAEKENESTAKDISEHLHPRKEESIESEVKLTLENGQEIAFSPSNIRYVEAMQNYVLVWQLVDGQLTKETIRATVSHLEKQFANTDVVRCHRSYLVNSDAVENVSGNAQGLRLKLADVTDVEVPVSRSFIPRVKEILSV